MQIEIVDIITPKNYQLGCLGAMPKPKVHIYSWTNKRLILGKTTFGLASDDSAVLSFNNQRIWNYF